jgi:penicillin amidase
MKALKVIGVVVVVLAGIVLLGWAGLRWFTHQAIPKTSGRIKAEGLQQPVEALRDEFDVAHIYADNPHDLFFAQGYTHAQERFWQMEFQRRIAAGRLSEVFGETTLETDIYLRNFGFHDLAQQAYELADAETQSILDAYAEGVNAYISKRSPAKLGLEFALLGVQGNRWEIEPWTPADTLAWGEMMIFDQADILSPELFNAGVLSEVGAEMFADIHLEQYRDDRPTIIQTEDLQAALPAAPENTALPREALEFAWQGLRGMQAHPARQALAQLGLGISGGSNSFVVNGELSQTGNPILANDPHMGVLMPAIWYQVGLHCREKSAECPFELRGYSLPGVPGILIGHNDRIAWGLTNASFDAEDVFIEKINPAKPDQYEANGKWQDMEIRREEIWVKGREEPVVIRVRKTRNGLVASDHLVDRKMFSYEAGNLQPYALSFAWTALEPIRSVQAVIKANKAQNWDEFVNALQYFDAGKQNWLYADVDGNIGYYMPGKVPIRGKGDGTMPAPGWTDEYRWNGFIPYEDLPHVFNPQQGFIAAPNNLQIRADDYPYLLGKLHDRGQRADRITSLIEGDVDGLSLDDMAAIQTDNQELAAMEITPYLKDLSFDDPAVQAGGDRLAKWDGQMYVDSPEGALYSLFWKRLLAETFHDQLSQDLYPEGNTWWADVVYFLLKEPRNPWWDDSRTPDVIETREDVLKKAFEQAYADGVTALGEEFTEWQWGTLHTITFRNATLGESGIGLIENIFNRGPFPVNGADTVVQKTCYDVNSEGFDTNCIPAMRQVIDLGDLGNSRMIHSVGQSGHPYAEHYDDLIELWRTFQYIPTNWSREMVEAGEHQSLNLTP